MAIARRHGRFCVVQEIYIKTVDTFAEARRVEEAAQALLAQTRRDVRVAFGDDRGMFARGTWQKGQLVRTRANTPGVPHAPMRKAALKRRAARARRLARQSIEYT